MISINSVISIIKKELKGHLDNPSSYISLVVFVTLWEFLFFKNVFLVGEASLRILYDYLPWVLMFFAGAVTMSSFAQEKSEGTLELILTHPVRQLEVVVGKFISNWIFVGVALLFSLLTAFSINMFGTIDWGIYLAQFLSGWLFSGSLVSLGLFLSILFSNQIAALLATVAISFFFIIAGSEFFTLNIPLSLVPLFERLSILTHVTSMGKGVVDIRDLWYFISFIIIFLSLSCLQLLKEKYGNRKDYFRRFQTGIALFIGIAVLTNIIGERIPGRLDLTAGRLYSLSEATKKSISSLTDIVTLTFYSSSKLPGQLTPVVREVKDIIRDYADNSRGNITVINKDPSGNSEIANEANALGVKEIQFNVIGQEEFQLKTGFIGLVVSFGDKHEVIPYIESTSDLEYQLTSFITKLTSKDKKTIGFLTGHGEKSIDSDYQSLNTELGKQFETINITVDKKDPQIASNAAVLVVAGPVLAIEPETKTVIRNYLDKGKSVLFLLDVYKINTQSLSVLPNENGFNDLLSDYGVKLDTDMVYDLRSNETIRLGSQSGFGFFLPYPYWLRALPENSSSPVTGNIESVVLPWTSSITLDEGKTKEKNLEVKKILITSKYAGVKTSDIVLSPDKAEFSKDNLKEQLLAVSLQQMQAQNNNTLGKMIIVGNSEFLTDQFVSSTPENLGFGMNAISWLSSEKSLAGIRIKQTSLKKLLFENQLQPTIVKYGNMILAFLIPAGVGFYRFRRRKSRRNLVYKYNET